jgi:hypothetical protein
MGVAYPAFSGDDNRSHRRKFLYDISVSDTSIAQNQDENCAAGIRDFQKNARGAVAA